MLYVVRCLFVGNLPRDHHNEHRLDQAVQMAVFLFKMTLIGKNDEQIMFVYIGKCLKGADNLITRYRQAPERSG